MILFSVGDDSESDINFDSYEKDNIDNYNEDENNDFNVNWDEMNNIQEFQDDQNSEYSMIRFGSSENLLERYSDLNENIQESCTFDDQNSVFSCISSVAEYHSFAEEDDDFDESREINDKIQTLNYNSEKCVDFFASSNIFKFENGSELCHDSDLFKCPPTVKAWIQSIYKKKNDFEELGNFKSDEYFTKVMYHNENDTKSSNRTLSVEAPMKNILFQVQEIVKNDKEVISDEFFKSGSYDNEVDLEPSKCSPSVRSWIQNIMFKNENRVNKDEAITYSDAESVNDTEEINTNSGGIVSIDEEIYYALSANPKNVEYFTRGPEFFGLRKRRNLGY